MSTVSSAALLGGLVDLDVLDNQVAGVKTLGVGIGLGVLQELQEELGGLDGPPGTGDTPLLACLSYCQPHIAIPITQSQVCDVCLSAKRPYSLLMSLLALANACNPPSSISSKRNPHSQMHREFRVRGIVRTLSSAANGASVAAHGDSLRLLLDVLKELDGALQLPAVDGLGGLAGVLEGHSEVGTAGAGRLGGSDLGGSVPNLFVVEATMVSFCPQAHRRPPDWLHVRWFSIEDFGINRNRSGLESQIRKVLTILTIWVWRWCRWLLMEMEVVSSGWPRRFGG